MRMDVYTTRHNQFTGGINYLRIISLQVVSDRRDSFTFDRQVSLDGFGGGDNGARFYQQLHITAPLQNSRIETIQCHLNPYCSLVAGWFFVAQDDKALEQ